jgi:hypothetical protein
LKPFFGQILPNKIGELCQNISKEIDSRVQDVLDGLSKDCGCLSKIVDEKVKYMNVEFRAPGAVASRPFTTTRMHDLLESPCSRPRALNPRNTTRESQVARNKKCVTHNTFSSVWKAVIGIMGVLVAAVAVYWSMVNHAEIDPLNLCDSSASKVQMRTLPDGSQIQVRTRDPNFRTCTGAGRRISWPLLRLPIPRACE